VRIGIAGVGRIGALHAATLAGAGHELLLADLDAARAAQVAAGLTGPGGAPATARVVAGAAELFVAGVDALVVASATDTHAGLLRRALVEGVPVFCEKPVSPALGETIELAELERATGTFAQIGFQRRFDAGYRRARAGGGVGRAGRGALGAGRDAGQRPAPGQLYRGVRRDLRRLLHPRLRRHRHAETARATATGSLPR
jgi:myo-inositol 2-dehydrogenase/D-chiro-inositol 1-dehydrogenase